ncbi:hypothetical protein KXV73_009015 [Aspergillus fumigatus]|nr:hypothetical protein KXV73_009015 [Aspergillus fumigatus]
MVPTIIYSAILALSAFTPSVFAQTRSSGCGKQPSLANGVHNINGREYILKVPDNYDKNKAHHLVFGLHWRGGNMWNIVDGQSIQPWYGLETRAQGSAIFVAPNGKNAGWANYGGEDIAFIDASAGAVFKAVSVLSGGVISGCDGGNDPIAYLGIHGINDGVLPFQGGVNLAQKFVRNNGCQQSNVGTPQPGSRGSVRTDFKGCSKPVSFIAYDGGHDAAPLGVGSSLAPDATWRFFMAA